MSSNPLYGGSMEEQIRPELSAREVYQRGYEAGAREMKERLEILEYKVFELESLVLPVR